MFLCTCFLLQLVYILQKLFYKSRLILQNQPLISSNIIITIHLPFNDLLFQSTRTRHSFNISTKMPKSMHLNHHISKILPFRNHNITDHIVKIILRNTRNTWLNNIVINLHLYIRTMSFKSMLLQKWMNLITIFINFKTASSQIKITIVHIHRLS